MPDMPMPPMPTKWMATLRFPNTRLSIWNAATVPGPSRARCKSDSELTMRAPTSSARTLSAFNKSGMRNRLRDTMVHGDGLVVPGRCVDAEPRCGMEPYVSDERTLGPLRVDGGGSTQGPCYAPCD